MKIYADLSKQVGWESKKIKYPSLKDVENAIEKKDEYNLLRWYRFLESPINEKQTEIMNLIISYIHG